MGVYALSGVRFRKAVFLLGTVVLCLWVSTWGIIPMAVCAVTASYEYKKHCHICYHR